MAERRWTEHRCPPLYGATVFVVGVEHRPNGATRIFVGQRGKGRYVLLDPEGTEMVENAWRRGGHVTIRPSAIEGLPIFYESAPSAEAARVLDGATKGAD